jgi:UDP-glucose 4-epimerase
MMPKARCIIYGGGGFIGSHIAEQLLADDIRVAVFDRPSSLCNVEHIINDIEFIEGDFSNRIDVRESLNGQDYAIHLVSTTIPATSNQSPCYDVESNLIPTLHLLDECLKQKTQKIIFISSGGTVYGNPVNLPIREDHPTNPTCSYGIVKLAIEKYFNLYRQQGLRSVVLRLANPFGERQNPNVSQGLIASLLNQIRHQRPLTIWGDGETVRDYFYVKDGAKAVAEALHYRGDHSTFNIASGEGISINRILEKFRTMLNLTFAVNYLPARSFDVTQNVLDISLARTELNWSPETGFERGLIKTWGYILDDK